MPLDLELLESRDLPSVTFYPDLEAAGAKPFAGSGPTGTTPTQIRQAYGFNQISFNGTPGDGRGTTIAIVDAFDDPNIASDLHQFDLQFGLPDPVFTKVNETGGSTMPSADAGWATEISLDVEWAHAIAPGANILLVEANSASDTDLFTAVKYAAAQPGVVAVSMSWGGGEFSGENSLDSTFTTPAGHTGVTFIASAGDSGAPDSYPSASPNVLSVGGTTLSLNSAGTILSETAWSGSGGGISADESQPSYQHGVVTQSTTQRTNPDVAYDADPNTGFPIYDSFDTSAPWAQYGGTSDAAPQWAGLIAIADQGRIANGLTPLDGPSQTLPMLYSMPASNFHDITSGSSTGTPPEAAGPGYDLVTGRGSPVANLVVGSLVGSATTDAATHFTMVASGGSPLTGAAFTVTVTALDANNNVVTGYTGTVHFTSTDGSATLPADYTFTSTDAGVHTFTVTLRTLGTETITATDKANSALTATVTENVVSVPHFSVTTSASATAGSAFSVTVTALNANNSVATGYTGTIRFTSSDGAAVLPANFMFSAANAGTHTFSVTLKTAGSQTITVTDSSNSSTVGSATVSVNPAAASKLVFGQQPTGATAGAILSPAVTVRVLDAFGNLLTGDSTDRVTLAFGSNPGSAPLGGTTTVTVSGGVATFSNLTVNNAGTGYTFVASSGSLTKVTSSAFTIAAVVSSSPTLLEGFETSDTWNVVGGPLSAARTTTAAHDGTYGLDMGGNGTWIYRSDAAAQVNAGDTLSVWLKFPSVADGRAYFAFGASSAGSLSLVAEPNTNQLSIQSNVGFGFTDLADANMIYSANQWYRLEVDWGTSGTIVGKIFASNGTTLLAEVTAQTQVITSGGFGFRATGHDKDFDTVTDARNTNNFSKPIDILAGTGAAGSSLQIETGTTGDVATALNLRQGIVIVPQVAPPVSPVTTPADSFLTSVSGVNLASHFYTESGSAEDGWVSGDVIGDVEE